MAPKPMNNTERYERPTGGPYAVGGKPHRPYWKRIHHSKFFWVSAFFILLAMGIFVMTDGFLLRPRGRAAVQGAGRP
jgi:hypothetical protein